MRQTFNVAICTFSYGGNGGISSEVPDIREWMVPLVAEATNDPRIESLHVFNLSDTPITMTRNRAVVIAREKKADFLVMVDSDMKPDLYIGQDPAARKFFQSSLDFLVDHYPKGPACVGAPYCGPPPAECVYVFRWQNLQSHNPNPDFSLEMYDRHTAAKMGGIQECAALPTGLIMYDMRCFDLTEPKEPGDHPWFYYEWKDLHCSEKASTEDVTQTRDLSLVGMNKLGYSPVFCNWDAWAGHWKPKCVGKPVFLDPADVSNKLKACWEAKVEDGVKLYDVRASKGMERKLASAAPPEPPFFDMGMQLPTHDAVAIRMLVQDAVLHLGRAPTVLEIGSWAGRSAIEFVKGGAETVMCVDTWEGSKNDDGTKAYDGRFGTPLEVFDRNTAHLSGRIKRLVGRSPEAAAHPFLADKYDIVYIDAEHDFDSVLADIACWRKKAGVAVAGHDYQLFESVREAVKEAFPFDVPLVYQGSNVWVVWL
jgi:hypothetical protein